MPRGTRRLGLGLGVCLALALALAPGCQFLGKSSGSAGSGAQPEDPERARELVAQAEKARAADKLYEARQRLTEAERYADDAVRAEIARVSEQIDRVEADALVVPVVEASKKGDCQLALSQAARASDRAHGTMPRFVRQGVAAPLQSCLEGALKKPEGKTLVRRLLDKPRTAELLGDEPFRAVASAVTKLIVEEAMIELVPLFAARHWSEARAFIDDLVAHEQAGPRERARLLEELQRGLSEQALGRLRQVPGSDKIGSSSPEAVLAEVDALLVQGGYAAADGSQSGSALPAPLAEARRAALVWLECRELKCKTVSARRLWAFGDAPLQPATEPNAPEIKLKHATALTQIAEMKGWALVVEGGDAKGSFAELAGRAKGWVREGDVRKDDTSRLLPPGDALRGMRVWGPLRKGEALLELGTVTAVSGDDIKVRRLSDHEEVTVPRSRLYLAVLEAGTRVLAACTGAVPADSARIDAVFETSDDPMANVVCLDAHGTPTGAPKNGPLGGLRNKDEWLKR